MHIYTMTKKYKVHQNAVKKRASKRKATIGKRGINKRSTSTTNKDHSFKIINYIIPKQFSFIHNFDESMTVFDLLIENSTHKRIKHIIDLRYIDGFTVEIILYLISLSNIWKKKKYKYKIEIKSPIKEELRLLLAKSGLGKYFRGNGVGHIDEEYIYPMCDGGHDTIDDTVSISQNDRVIEINTFTSNMLKDFPNNADRSELKLKIFQQTNAIAEMIRNTDDHAYEEEHNPFAPLRNWYFFAGKVQDGISFYFLDNGKGIINTAKQRIFDKLYLATDNLEPKLLEDVMNGNNRSRTNLSNRNKGLPEIKDFFQNADIMFSTIISNNTIYKNNNGTITYEKKKQSFSGTLYIWIIK